MIVIRPRRALPVVATAAAVLLVTTSYHSCSWGCHGLVSSPFPLRTRRRTVPTRDDRQIKLHVAPIRASMPSPSSGDGSSSSGGDASDNPRCPPAAHVSATMLILPLASAAAPNPNQQINTYSIHHYYDPQEAVVAAERVPDVVILGTVFARCGDGGAGKKGDGSNPAENDWQPVGYVSSSLGATSECDDTSGEDEENATAARISTGLRRMLFGAVQCQRRLITEHATRLHRPLRASKRHPGIELGIRISNMQTVNRTETIVSSYQEMLTLLEEDSDGNDSNNDSSAGDEACTIYPVPPSAENGQPSEEELSQSGFLGLLNDAAINNLRLYKDFFENHNNAVVKPITSTTNPLVGEEVCTNSCEDVDGEVLSPDYYKSVYDDDKDDNQDDGNNDSYPTQTSAIKAKAKTPWDVGGGRPQPTIVQAYEDGHLRGRILDAGCGAGENALYLASRLFGVTSVVGFDFAPGAIDMARRAATDMEDEHRQTNEKLPDIAAAASKYLWNPSPLFHVASCTNIVLPEDDADNDVELFDVSIDSGLLHCLSNDDAQAYVVELAKWVKPNTGKAFVGCFSKANPDPWQNPRRLDEAYLRNLFSLENGWEVTTIKETWWARPSPRGSSQGAFCLALWMEARRCSSSSSS